MTLRFCTCCWTQQVLDETECVRCGAQLVGPELDGVPYVDKLLEALRSSVPEIRPRAAALLGLIGESGDRRMIDALTHVLSGGELWPAVRDAELEAAVARALGHLGTCEASAALHRLAMDEATALSAGLSAVEALTELADAGCEQATMSIELLAREAGRSAVRGEACIALARLNEPS